MIQTSLCLFPASTRLSPQADWSPTRFTVSELFQLSAVTRSKSGNLMRLGMFAGQLTGEENPFFSDNLLMKRDGDGPRLVIICGLPGSRKTTLAKERESRLRAVRCAPD